MKHHLCNPSFNFIKKPIEFNKYSDHEQLQYCLGATMYMPGTKNILSSIFSKKWPELTSIVMCFEDAISGDDLPQAEKNVLFILTSISNAINEKTISFNDLPLFIIRVRSVDQFVNFTSKLDDKQIKLIAAFNFPKFSSINAEKYLNHLKFLNQKYNEVLYGMPILESPEIAYKETRIQELIKIKEILNVHRNLILNIRVGATDFSSCFGVRRGINYSIYDILPVRDCLSDIINLFSRDGNNYVISAPVWEYFLVSKGMKFKETPENDIHSSLLKRNLIIDEAIDGLLREVILDKANGFVGKTVIHPSHVKYVNALQAVTKEEYDDAMQILDTVGGVVKSASCNKMNEINPHRSWACKIKNRAKAYGVIENDASYARLFLNS